MKKEVVLFFIVILVFSLLFFVGCDREPAGNDDFCSGSCDALNPCSSGCTCSNGVCTYDGTDDDYS